MRFILAVLMLAGWGMGQTGASLKADHNIVSPDIPLTVTGQSAITIMAPIAPSKIPKTILMCNPVLDGKGKWTPEVKNCKLDNGGTLDDIINAMTDMREMERKQFDEERAKWKMASDLALKSATLYRSAYQKCMKAVDGFRLSYDPKAHKFSKDERGTGKATKDTRSSSSSELTAIPLGYSGGSGTVTFSNIPDDPSYSNCSSINSIDRSQWKEITSAPKDGSVVELAQTYGIAPTYGLFKYVNGWWQSASDEHMGMSQQCAFWRPRHGSVGSYQDPTGGAQHSVKYWCDAMHMRYDQKSDSCKEPK